MPSFFSTFTVKVWFTPTAFSADSGSMLIRALTHVLMVWTAVEACARGRDIREGFPLVGDSCC